jgi:predicted  nucleic acid-binding Zn-ribbon protein
LDAKIDAIDAKILSLRNEMNEKAKALEDKILSLRNEMNARFDSIEKRLPLIERLVLLEARIEKIEKQIGIH